jgi:hypothetical protein
VSTGSSAMCMGADDRQMEMLNIFMGVSLLPDEVG